MNIFCLLLRSKHEVAPKKYFPNHQVYTSTFHSLTKFGVHDHSRVRGNSNTIVLFRVVLLLAALHRSSAVSNVDVTSLSAGFSVKGAMANDASGVSVAGVGDMNGDGFGDFAIGAETHDQRLLTQARTEALFTLS